MIQPTLHQFIENCNDLDRIKRYSKLLNTLVTHENYKLVYTNYEENRKPSIDWMIQTRRTFEYFCNQDVPFTKHYSELVSKPLSISDAVAKFNEEFQENINKTREILKNAKKLPI